MSDDPELKAINEIMGALDGVEGNARQRVIKYVLDRLGLSLGSTDVPPPKPNENPSMNVPPPPAAGRGTDIRTLKEQKVPRSAIQMTTLVAFYLQEAAPIEEQKKTIAAEDVERYFKQAGFKLPAGKNGAMDALNNTKRAGYLEAAGRGVFKLNPVGYNLVTHVLPDANNVKKAPSKKKRPTSSPSRKK